MNIFHFISQIESIVAHWPWWSPGAIGISIVLIPVILFGPLSKVQKLYEFIVEFFFTAACFGTVSLYAVYGLVHFDKFLAGLAVVITFLEAFVFSGILIFSTLVSVSDHFESKRIREHDERMKRLITLGNSSDEGGI